VEDLLVAPIEPMEEVGGVCGSSSTAMVSAPRAKVDRAFQFDSISLPGPSPPRNDQLLQRGGDRRGDGWTVARFDAYST
jgi:hypothetical protein